MFNSRGRFIARFILGLLLCAGLVTLVFEAHPLLNRLHALQAQRPNIAPRFPAFTVRASTNIDDSLGSDAPGSTLIDNNGAFHFFATLSQYDNADKSDAFVKTYTNTDLGEMNRHPKGNAIVTDDTFIKTPGALCYKIDKRAVNPIETPFEDDRCDVIGTWIDHDTGTWYGVVHDEYFFNPWSAKDKGNVLSGVHFDRLMYATSTNKGASWQLQDEILTSPFGDHATTTAFLGKTWYFGDGDPRLFVDYSTGYFYVYYYSRIFLKSGAELRATRMSPAPPSAERWPRELGTSGTEAAGRSRESAVWKLP